MARTLEEREQERRDELLSAYLDDQLSAEERERLEAQLASDPTLDAELETLRHTVSLVRDLPQVEVPRNFILPQTMAARPRPAPSPRPRLARFAPLLTAATAVASFLFVAVLSRDLVFRGSPELAFAPPAPQMAAEAPAEEMAPVLGEEAVEVEAEDVVSRHPLTLRPHEPVTEVVYNVCNVLIDGAVSPEVANCDSSDLIHLQNLKPLFKLETSLH